MIMEEMNINVIPGDDPSKLRLPFKIYESQWCLMFILDEPAFWYNIETKRRMTPEDATSIAKDLGICEECFLRVRDFIEFGGKETPPMRSIGSPQGCPLWVGRNCRTLLY